MKTLRFSPKLTAMDGARMEAHAAGMIRDTARMDALRAAAEKALATPPVSVVNRAIRAASGDVHDYSSCGPYWWPNPDTPDGMPYIRRDGEINPASRDASDFSHVFAAVETLTLAAYYFDEPRYAADAVRRIRVFFLDPETLCHPHLKYSQAIPGTCDGRGIGIIDTHMSFRFFAAVALLDAMGELPAEVMEGVRAWYNAFTDWLLTDENGRDEFRQHNNHGAWYDEQVAAAALFLDRKILAESTLTLAYEQRTLKHIRPDGTQPYELARTNAMSYSLMNLLALMLLANMAEYCGAGIDQWNTVRAEGDLPLRSALEYVARHASDLTDFPYRQINGKPEPDACARLMTIAARHYPDGDYLRRAAALQSPTSLWCLWPW